MAVKADRTLPPTWVECMLGDIISYGATEKVEPTEIPPNAWVLELEDIEKDTSRLTRRWSYAERHSKSTKNAFKAGDVLYGKLRPYLNKVLIADADGYCTTEIQPLRVPPCVDRRYLFYWLKSPRFLSYVEANSHGLNMPRLGTQAGHNAPFVLAPEREQVRIAERLQTLLNLLADCHERLDRTNRLLKKFRQAVLASAAFGQLSHGWRSRCNVDTASLPWAEVALGELVNEATNGLSKRKAQSGTPTVVLRLSDFNDGARIEGRQRLIPLDPRERLHYSLEPEDILVVRVNGSRDIAGQFIKYRRLATETEAFCDHFIRLRLNRQVVDPDYLVMIASSPVGRNLVQPRLVTSAGQYTINQKSLSEVLIPLPSLEEQAEIVRCVFDLLSLAESIESRSRDASSWVQQLTNALLDRAFSGELVAQDPEDESASALLVRLRAEGAARESERRLRRQFRREPRYSNRSRNLERVMLKRSEIARTHLSDILGRQGRMHPKELLDVSRLEVEDFYKQLRLEIDQGLILRPSRKDVLESSRAS